MKPITIPPIDDECLQALLDAVPFEAMNYTPQGQRVYAAYAAISQALKPPKPKP